MPWPNRLYPTGITGFIGNSAASGRLGLSLATLGSTEVQMELKSYKNILGIRGPQNQWIGFHTHNLELAELPSDPWLNPQDLEEWSKEVNPETRSAKDLGFVNSLSVNVAQVCNLACTYCAAGGDGTYGAIRAKLNTEKFLPQLQMVLDQLPDHETLNIHFLGGEPLLFPKVIEEIARFTQKQMRDIGRPLTVKYSITTNGTLINKLNAQLLAHLQMGVTISLDGAPEVNDRVRPNKGKQSSTEMTVAGIKALTPWRDRLDFLSVNCVFGSHNLDIMGAYDYLSRLGAQWDIYNFNFSNEDKSLDVTNAYIAKMSELAEKVYARSGLAGLAKIAQFRGTMSRIESQTRIQSYCGAGKSLLQVDTANKFYPCNWFMTDPGEAVGENLHIQREKLVAFEKPLSELNNCQSCWARNLCAGGCMAVHKASTGSKHQKDPLFCLRSRSLAAVAIFYYYQALTKGESHEECKEA